MNQSSIKNARWSPIIGDEARALLANSAAPADSHDSILQSSQSILSKCLPPNEHQGHETGLVIGYVQSGKTLSFTTIAALARDNLFPIVILIAGTTMSLFNQSSKRLQRDLRLETRQDRKWQFFQFHKEIHQESMISAIKGGLDDWADPNVPDNDKKTVLVTVMKHHRWLDKLHKLISNINLTEIPILIIDDEADQASLNTRSGTSEQSTTYRRIMELRYEIPHHTFLQYTATPQAPLLINIIDTLSPNFVEILHPGEGYVGGRDFFIDLSQSHVKPIPTGEVPTRDNIIEYPPVSLLYSLRLFIIGVTAHLINKSDVGNCSMMVHPSRLTAPHSQYFHWVKEAFDSWQKIFQLPETDPDRRELIRDFGVAYDDLEKTTSDLPDFEVICNNLLRAFRLTTPLEVNAVPGKTPTIPWSNNLGWILVGGQAMDRGFTVEGLTVTYMPRGAGVGNADTVQQRGRFFGYKQDYVGYCRIFLENGVMNAFHDYVEHEEDVRSQLEEYQNSGEPLDNWKRAFILSRDLRPTRNNVLSLDYMRGRFGNKWFHPRFLLAANEVIVHNRQITSDYTSSLNFVDDEGHEKRTPAQRHKVAKNIPLKSALEKLLVPYKFPDLQDSQNGTGAILQLSWALDRNPDELCQVYHMRPTETTKRSLKDNGKLSSNLFQGANPSKGPQQGEVYPGDRDVKIPDQVAIQIHYLNLTYSNEEALIAENVPVISIWIPKRMEVDWLVQEDAA